MDSAGKQDSATMLRTSLGKIPSSWTGSSLWGKTSSEENRDAEQQQERDAAPHDEQREEISTANDRDRCSVSESKPWDEASNANAARQQPEKADTTKALSGSFITTTTNPNKNSDNTPTLLSFICHC